jgi:hypothetical protein
MPVRLGLIYAPTGLSVNFVPPMIGTATEKAATARTRSKESCILVDEGKGQILCTGWMWRWPAFGWLLRKRCG